MKKETITRRSFDQLDEIGDITLKGLKKSIVSFESFKEVIEGTFHHSLFAKDISKTGVFNALVFITFSMNFTLFSFSDFNNKLGLVPSICIIVITGLSSFFIQSSIVPYIRNIKNKQGTYSAFIYQHFGSFAAVLFDLLVFLWFAFDIMYALYTIIKFLHDLPHAEEYYMYIWLTPIICLVFLLHHRMTCSCLSYFNVYFSLLLNSAYIIIAVVFLALNNKSSKVKWNITFGGLQVYDCFQAFSVFSFGLSKAMLVFWVVNQYSGIAFSNKRYLQMGLIYVFVLIYFTALGVIDVYLNQLNLVKKPDAYEASDYFIWIWVFRGIYCFQWLTQLSYMFSFLRRLVFREEIRILLNKNGYFFSLYAVFLGIVATVSVLIQRKIIGGFEYFDPTTYSLIANGTIGFLLNFFLPILIYIKFSEKKLGGVRMIAKVIICFIFSIFALSYFYPNMLKKVN